MIRTRFAPSPTGAPHVGNIRTALYAWLFARHSGGAFLVRIEDTDQSREKETSIAEILEALSWLGMDIDEGVVAADGSEIGAHGPYTQSKRLEVYQEHAKKLVLARRAFYCFCSEERLSVLRELQRSRKEPPRYDGRCSRLEPDEVERFLSHGTPHVVRLLIPAGGETVFQDAVKGEVSIKNETVDSQVLLKSDGFPTYHLASVVDDHLMRITHVIRADEWLPSTPKHVLLYRAFGWAEPVWVHLPVILGTDRTKLSKRHGARSVLEYRKDYLPDALVNYLALLGWNPKTDQEILSREELIEQFDLAKINKGNPIFDVAKLNWLNGEYLRKLPDEELASLVSASIPTGGRAVAKKAIALVKDRMDTLSDFGPATEFLWKDKLEYAAEILVPKESDKRTTLMMLKTASNLALNVHEGDWDEGLLRQTFFAYCESNRIPKGELLWPLRVAVTGLERSPDVFGVMDILGRKQTLERVRAAILKMGD